MVRKLEGRLTKMKTRIGFLRKVGKFCYCNGNKKVDLMLVLSFGYGMIS